MQQSNALLDAIWQETCEVVDQIKKQADEYVEAKKDAAEQAVLSYRAEQNKVTERMCQDIMAKRQAQADMDSRKYALGQKRELLAEVYRRLYNKLIELDADGYLRLVSNLLTAWAEAGDRILVSAQAPVDLAAIQRLEVVKAKGLCLVSDEGLENGLIIEGKAYDKDCRYLALCQGLQQEGELDISRKLFG